MITDHQTRRDLELFEARDGGPSVLTQLDRTATEIGHRRLRHLLSHPLRGRDEIEARHAAIDFLAATDVTFCARNEAIRRLRGYLESNYTTLTKRPAALALPEAVWHAVRYPEMARKARAGIGSVTHVVGVFSGYLDALSREAMPPTVDSLVREAVDIRAELAPFIGHARWPWTLFDRDRALRVTLRARLERYLEIVAEFDALSSAAQLLRDDFVLPAVVGGEATLGGEGLFHPFLEEGVGNPVSLDRGDTLVFLTGPNMAGKTTYLKALGLSLYLGHCGLPVPARRLRFTPMDRLVTGLAPEDNLRQGVSYFLAEVRRVKEVVSAVAKGERVMAIFDEVFRGTNVTDAAEATTAVLLGCARARSSMFVFSSHLVEIAVDLANRPGVRFCYFDGELEDDRLRFGFHLHEGVSNQRFGMELLRREGLPQLLDAIHDGG